MNCATSATTTGRSGSSTRKVWTGPDAAITSRRPSTASRSSGPSARTSTSASSSTSTGRPIPRSRRCSTRSGTGGSPPRSPGCSTRREPARRPTPSTAKRRSSPSRPATTSSTRINRRHLDALTGRSQTAVAEITGDFGRGDASYPADAELQLKVGAQVMFLRNDTASYGEPPRWVNGTIGTVTRISGGTVRVDVDGEEHEVEPAVWERFRYAYDPGVEVAEPRHRGRVHAVPAAAGLGRHDPQVAGQDLRAGHRRPRLGRLRARPDLRRAVAPDLARRPLPLAPAAPERHPSSTRTCERFMSRRSRPAPAPRCRAGPGPRADTLAAATYRLARRIGSRIRRSRLRRPGTASRRRGRRRARC